jgi:prolipoprotein diacylglyceryltransferase
MDRETGLIDTSKLDPSLFELFGFRIPTQGHNSMAYIEVVGFIKGKSAIAIARTFGRTRNFTNQSFWARGYDVSTVGRDEAFIRQYIQNQEKEDLRCRQVTTVRACHKTMKNNQSINRNHSYLFRNVYCVSISYFLYSERFVNIVPSVATKDFMMNVYK